MVELLFLVALVAWVAISVLEYLVGLPAAATLTAAAVLLPLLVPIRQRALAHKARLDFVRGKRRPVPPERFYWPVVRRSLGWRLTLACLLAASAWPLALACPARLALDPVSLTGWAAGALGIAALAEALASGWLYVKASQRFNRLKPGFVGWLRRGLYRLSDNHEFLAEEPLPRRKAERESVY
jgi:membrane protease YdiL (CAAX protease family)